MIPVFLHNCGIVTWVDHVYPGGPVQPLRYYKIVVVLEGHGRIIDRSSDLAIASGTALLLQPGRRWRLEDSAGVRVRQACFDIVAQALKGELAARKHADPRQGQPDLQRAHGVIVPTLIPEPVASQVTAVLAVTKAEYWRDPLRNARSAARLSLLLADLLILCQDRFSDRPSAAPTAAHDPHSNIVEQAQQFLHTYLPNKIAVAELAKVIGVSREHLSRAFRQRTGRSPSAWIADHRWMHVVERLADGQIDPGDAGRLLGYRSAPSFSRAFRKRFGMSPSDFAAAAT